MAVWLISNHAKNAAPSRQGSWVQPARMMGQKTDPRPESQFFCRRYFGYFTNQEMDKP
jgi:hypothetical protein